MKSDAELIPGVIYCMHCNAPLDIIPPDPLSPMNGFIVRDFLAMSYRFVDIRTGMVFHECPLKENLNA